MVVDGVTSSWHVGSVGKDCQRSEVDKTQRASGLYLIDFISPPIIDINGYDIDPVFHGLTFHNIYPFTSGRHLTHRIFHDSINPSSHCRHCYTHSLLVEEEPNDHGIIQLLRQPHNAFLASRSTQTKLRSQHLNHATAMTKHATGDITSRRSTSRSSTVLERSARSLFQ